MREKRGIKLLKEIMAKNFLNLAIEKDIQIQEAQEYQIR